MRFAIVVAALLVVLSGCTSGSQEAQSDGESELGSETTSSAPGGGGSPASANPALQVLYFNGTIQNVGQCIVWSQDEIGGIEWHEIDKAYRGAEYEVTISAVAGPPAQVLPNTGACLYWEAGGTRSTGPLTGTVGDVDRVAFLTDAMVDGGYSIKLTPA